MAQTYSFADLMPDGVDFVDGEFVTDDTFCIQQLHVATIGDLQRCEYQLEMDFGQARYATLGGHHYALHWGDYRMQGGISSYYAELRQPVIEMHFQLQGALHTKANAFIPDVHMRSGTTNLVYMPPGSSEYTVDMEEQGAVFEVHFAPEYFIGLAERYPHLLGSFLDKLLQQKSFFLCGEPLQITPAMHRVIQRIQRREAGSSGSSLFIESQILELLALQLEQVRQPHGLKESTLARADVDKLHAARNLLLAHMVQPPSLADLARHVGINEFTLKRGFKALFGRSPYAFVLHHKLETVCSYLLDTDLTIAEIAYRVGYSDPAHLTHAFRKRYGKPPRDFRNGQRIRS